MPPLPTLLSQVLGHLTDEAESAVDEGSPSLPVWANVLRCVGVDGLIEGDLPSAARLSRRLSVAAVTHVLQGSGRPAGSAAGAAGQ